METNCDCIWRTVGWLRLFTLLSERLSVADATWAADLVWGFTPPPGSLSEQITRQPRIKACIGCDALKDSPHEEWCPVVTGTLSTLPKRAS